MLHKNKHGKRPYNIKFRQKESLSMNTLRRIQVNNKNNQMGKEYLKLRHPEKMIIQHWLLFIKIYREEDAAVYMTPETEPLNFTLSPAHIIFVEMNPEEQKEIQTSKKYGKLEIHMQRPFLNIMQKVYLV